MAMTQGNFTGVLVPALTPFKADLSADRERYLAHLQWLLRQGADGLAIFGTTSEANSMSTEEKIDLLDFVIEGGIAPAKLMPGTGCCALTDSVRLTVHAAKRKCGGVLMLPPFYYKGVGDDGLFRNFSEVIQRVGDANLKVYLYHIPPQSATPITLNLIGQLVKAYPKTVVGLKDSSGDWSNTAAVLKAFPAFDVFPGSELFLLQGLRAGGQGCITATGNIDPAGIRKVFEAWRTPGADELQAGIDRVRKTVQGYPMIPSLKRMIAYFHDDPEWVHVRPPLVDLADDKWAALRAQLEAIGFRVAPR
jgi:4-hydroxy-tetrahydrodipicolinate synthase